MKKINYTYLFSPLAWLLVCTTMIMGITACHKDANSNEAEDTPQSARFSFILKLPGELSVDSRAEGSVPSLSGIPFNDVWVLQYKVETGNTTTLSAAKYYTGESITGEAQSDYLVIVPTGDGGSNAYFTNEESRFYIIVNGGIELLGEQAADGSAPELSTIQTNYNSEASIRSLLQSIPASIATDPGLLAVENGIDFKPGTTDAADAGGAASIPIRATLVRTYARIDVCYQNTKPEDGKFTPTDAVLVNQPTHLALFSAEGKNTPYPPVSVGADVEASQNHISTTEVSLKNGDWTANPWQERTETDKNALTFYTSENLRGQGIATTYSGKSQSGNGPGTGGSLEGCTHLILRGTYRYRTGFDATSKDPIYSTDGIGVEYKIYLGGNLTNDYNVRRNMHYTVTVNIGGANSADARVTITDGNVIVFDDSDTIENTIDFNS